MTEHIVTSFENELRDLNRKVVEMGGPRRAHAVGQFDATR